MLDKYFVAYLVFTIVKNAVGDISLDYYFGFDDALRTARYMENCNSNEMQESCQQRCGPNHACLLGKCFCVEVKPQIKKDEALIRQLKKDVAARSPRHGGHREDYDESATGNLNSDGLKTVLEHLLRRRPDDAQEQPDSSNAESSSDSDSEETGRRPVNLRKAFLGHGCHSLEKADECVRKCSVTGQQGFCDENQECNCGVYRNNFIGRSSPKMSNMYTKSHELEEMALRPALRHHIAHFCPNLDIARECIYKCMKIRKPAFCGKDHVCYCGHKYGTPKNDYEYSSEETFGVFDDLYAKYFGPKHHSHHHHHMTFHAVDSSTSTQSSTTLVTSTEEQTEYIYEDNDGPTTELSSSEELTTEGPTSEKPNTEASTDETSTIEASTTEAVTIVKSDTEESAAEKPATEETTTEGVIDTTTSEATEMSTTEETVTDAPTE